eukprot:4020475-Alexandrium_andersonii.AAC.1
MSASLVGSEMCIRDRLMQAPNLPTRRACGRARGAFAELREQRTPRCRSCLLYTSDAADDM